MATPAAAPRARWVDPTDYLPLKAYECGRKEWYALEVDTLAHKMYRGEETARTRVAEDPETGQMLGFYGIQQNPLLPLYLDAAYVMVIGVTPEGRGIGVGDFLLSDALTSINTDWGGGTMPPVWAVIADENERSQALVTRHEFKKLGAHPDQPCHIWLRPRGVPPETRREEVAPQR